MSLVWGLPLGLIAFVALLLPVLLHLDRRRTLQTLRFAALRWIGTRHPPRRTVRITEWLLLLLRLLLLASLALWLAQPLLRGEWRAPQRWLVVEPGVDADAVRAASVGIEQRRWLAPGFPDIEQPPGEFTPASASLLRELDAQLGSNDTLRVLSPGVIGGLDASSIVLSRPVQWQITAGSTDNATNTRVPARPPPQLVLWRDPGMDDSDSLFWLQAAIDAWSRVPGFGVELISQPRETSWPAQADAVIIIGEPLPDAARTLLLQGSSVLQIGYGAPPTDATPAATPVATATAEHFPAVVQRIGRGRLLTLHGPLRPQRMPLLHDAAFPLQLHRLLFGESPAPAVARAEQVEPTRQQRVSVAPDTPLRPWLAILAAVLFLLERWLANGSRLRGVA